VRRGRSPVPGVLTRRAPSLRRQSVDHLRKRLGQLRQEIVPLQARALLEGVDGVGSEGVGELPGLDRAVVAMTDPGFDRFPEAAALEAVDQPVEPGLAVAGLAVEAGVGARAGIAPGRSATSGAAVAVPWAVEHSGQVAEIAVLPIAVLPIALREAALPVDPFCTILAETAEIALPAVSAGLVPTGLVSDVWVVATGACATAQEVAEAAGALRHQKHQQGLHDGREVARSTAGAAALFMPATTQNLSENAADDLIEEAHDRFSRAAWTP